MTSCATELALRAAVNTNSRDLTDAGEQAESIKGVALQRVQGLSTAGTNPPLSAQLSSAQSEAIGLAVAGVALAYGAISHQLGVLYNQRLAFDKERAAGIASFMVPTNQEERNLSREEKVMKSFIELVNSPGNASFSSYLGIHSADLSTDSSGKFYSVLPFYRMSEALDQPLASSRPLDRQRTAINLFLKSALPEAIAKIDNSFQTDWKIGSFFVSAWQRKNYLNNRRAPRFVMMSLSNLLWNLQHPVDPVTGFPLGINRCIQICRDVELCLNQLLDHTSSPYLQNITNEENQLMGFMRKLELYTKTLRAAYAEEQLHELNIADITNSAHSALRIMDIGLYKLLYKRKKPISGKEEPDDKAAETLAEKISYLNLLLTQNPTLVQALQPIPTWIPQIAGMNTPPQTIIDVLILFSHLSSTEQDRLLARFKNSTLGSEIEFAATLKEFDKKFVEPIRAVSIKELSSTVVAPKLREIGCLTAQRLVPFMTLLIEDYGIEVDTPETYKSAKESQIDPTATQILSGKQQAQSINLSAKTVGCGLFKMTSDPGRAYFREIALSLQGKDAVILFNNRLYYADIRKQQVKRIEIIDAQREHFNALKLLFTDTYKRADANALNLINCVTGRAEVGGGYYNWTLSPFVEGGAALDELPKCQYRMTQVTKLMDSVGELVNNYRSFLLQKSFQTFLLKCLNKVKAESAILEQRISMADALLDHTEQISRSLQAILRPMTSGLNTSLDDFSQAIDSFEHVVSAPDFTDQQRQLLSSKLGAIDIQFSVLFAEDSGLAALLEGTSPPDDAATATAAVVAPPPAAVPPPIVRPRFVEARTVIAVKKLVQNCHDALSYQSREGRKGLLLRELIERIDRGPDFTERQIKHFIMELTRVAASYRETWFFQAAYGQTSSAKVLIAAMKDKALNKVLPLASIIFDQPSVNVSNINDQQITQRFKSLRASNRWQDEATNMRIIPDSAGNLGA